MDKSTLERALADAHIPTLVVVLVHLTGDDTFIDTSPKPVYNIQSEYTGLTPEFQDAVRSRVVEAILANGGEPVLREPSEAQIRKMMNYIAGKEIPEHYIPYLKEFLVDPNDPDLIGPRMKTQTRRMSVLIVGAGMSGILAAIRLKRAGVDFVVVEKNADVGGTWLENTYPGCRVDSWSHHYSYSFTENHIWPYYFSTQPVLLDYFRTTAKRYDIYPHIRFESTVDEARYDGRSKEWSVTVRGKDGTLETIRATAVVSAVGQLNIPRYPTYIDGYGRFEGPSFHSSRWDHSVDLDGKRVAVVGTGASAIQFVPAIAPSVKRVTVFQRSPPWLLPTPKYHEPVPLGENWLIQHLPFYGSWYRVYVNWRSTSGVYAAARVDPDWKGDPDAISEANAGVRSLLIRLIASQVVDDNVGLLDAVTPKYPVGGKRMLRDNGVWLKTLQRPNVDLVTEKIVGILPDGVATADGNIHKADVLVYGTGFEASSFLATYRIYGRDGVELHDRWKGDARAYLGITVPGFPNFFMIYGPNTNIVVNNSIIDFSQCAARYIVACLDLLAESGAATMEVREDVHDRFNEEIDAANLTRAWGLPDVSSWYKNEFGRVSQNWPYQVVEYWKATLKPNPDEFILTALD